MRRLPISTLNVAAGYAVAAALLWFFVRAADYRVLVDGLRSAGWRLLAAGVVFRLLSLIATSRRWQLLLLPVGAVPLRGILAATMMGMAVSAVAPMQAAEVARPYIVSRRYGVAFSSAMATVVVEWVLDALAVLTLFLPALMWTRGGWSNQVVVSGWPLERALGLSALVACAGFGALRLAPRAMATGHLGQFAAGLRILERADGLVGVAAYSLLVAALTAVSAWLSLIAFGLPVSFTSGFLVLGLVTVAGMIPTPAAAGGFHAVCQLGLVAFFNIDRAHTVLPVIALHGVLYVPGALLGALCFMALPRGAGASAA